MQRVNDLGNIVQIHNRSPIHYAPDGGNYAICICGTYFRSDGQPTPAMFARLVHLLNLLAHFERPPLVLACGGSRGTMQCLPSVTEAHLIQDWLRQRGVQDVYRDDFSRETIGNLVFAYVGLLQPLGLRRVIFVTDSIHAPRVSRLANHILKNLTDVIVMGADPALSTEDRMHQERLESAGSTFVDAFINEVPPGNPDRAFEWVSTRHHDKPYSAWQLSAVKRHLRQQMWRPYAAGHVD